MRSLLLNAGARMTQMICVLSPISYQLSGRFFFAKYRGPLSLDSV